MLIAHISNNYSLFDLIKLSWYWILTKLICPRARLIRFPFHMRGTKMISLGENLTTGVGCRIEALLTDKNNYKKIVLGSNVQINDYVHISALSSVHIGDNTLMASHVYISDNSHGSYKGDNYDTSPEVAPAKRPYLVSPVKIGANVWLGEGVIVLPGVTIGDGAIIGAHSIVNNKIPANCIAVGSPAKVIKRWNKDSNHWEKYTIC